MKCFVLSLLLLCPIVAFSKARLAPIQPLQSKPTKFAYIENVPGEKIFLDFYSDLEGEVEIEKHVHLKKYPNSESLKPVNVKLWHIYVSFEKRGAHNLKTNRQLKSKELMETLELPSEAKLMSHIRIVMDPEIIISVRHK